MNFLNLFLPILALIAIALLLMSINILIKKNGKFSSEHIGQSKAMKRQGIHCAQTQDKVARKKK